MILTLPVDLLECRSINVCHGVQIKIEKTIKSHELRGRAVISGETRSKAVLQYTGSELTCSHQTANAGDYRGEQC